ncbi:hypothetical protein [Halegenticoccus tardaugens]|uniref:hypothetical protein n=1 Tax=Halegenticoccus tardaugens TaxID=2071624 RepID=UPI001E5D9BB2|nr:hypothetical protein [Halegenticoccus tardaugens]
MTDAEPTRSNDAEDEARADRGAPTNADFEPDAERVRFLREIADDVHGDSSESSQIAAVLYRVSDLYDEDGDTSPEEIYRNVRNIMRVKSRGGLRR